ncbi:hypothetical protein ZIOFF_017890 [Zingiber officinale]|uniref:Auxin-responsive protein n=1 Tax=Zingiber officinale TaxID=94328 RepID=A0A8J5LLP4_ZINOF|nr:hypothetical protein ZIOFF_017890 [Zingiber officinale]
MAPNKNWMIVFTDNEDDMMLVGDDPWEFCAMVRQIFIYTKEEVQKMDSSLVKILKKYDKRTGALIRQPFIEKVLQQPIFTIDLLYKLVKECVAMLDHLFPSNNLSISAECDEQNGVPKPAQSGRRVPELEEIKYMQSLYMMSTVAALRIDPSPRSSSTHSPPRRSPIASHPSSADQADNSSALASATKLLPPSESPSAKERFCSLAIFSAGPSPPDGTTTCSVIDLPSALAPCSRLGPPDRRRQPRCSQQKSSTPGLLVLCPICRPPVFGSDWLLSTVREEKIRGKVQLWSVEDQELGRGKAIDAQGTDLGFDWPIVDLGVKVSDA